ncbi:MAG: beta-N-acetylhexosaminidase, partial [Candidatus Krumholzibacteria bacterium]|nr:beta-N-acetylhexosaminidase [Candidatus Krumholzibacteria bacterium]
MTTHEDIAIIPAPHRLRRLTGAFTLTNSTKILTEPENEALADIGKRLADKLNASTGFQIVSDTSSQPEAPKGTIFITTKCEKTIGGKEGYTLEVLPKAITINATTAAGISHAVQTLRQLFPPEIESARPVDRPVPWTAPAVRVEDEPRFEWRGLLFDSCRHFSGKDFIFKTLDLLAYHKLNRFHWHLTDDQGWRIEIKKYPKLTEIGSIRHDTQIGGWKSEQRTGVPHKGFYTQEQIKEIVRYAADRHITIVPEIEMPGHASAAIAAYPELSTKREKIEVPDRFGKHQNCFNPADEKVYRILSDILDEVVALFPGEVIHIGGDEVRFNHWKESDEIKQLMQREGLKTYADVQIYFTNRMSHIIEEKGRRMMGWNEILG